MTQHHTGRNLNAHNLPIIGAGLLGLISSFLPWFGYKYRGWTNYNSYGGGGGYGYNYGRGYGGYGQMRNWSSGLNAWHSGSLAWLPILLMLAAAALAAAHMLANRGRGGGLGSVGTSTAIAALSALSLLLIVVRWITLPHVNGYFNGYHAVSSGARSGLILGLISSILMTLFALRRLKASGETGGRRYDRDVSMAGYGTRGADRTRVADRERVEAGGRTTTDQQQRGYTTTTTTTTERTYPSDRDRERGGSTEQGYNSGSGRVDRDTGDRGTRDRWER